MRTKLIFIILLFVSNSIVISPIISEVRNASSQITYTYDVLESKWWQECGNLSAFCEGYNFNDISFPVGTQFTVTADFEHEYTYTIKVNDQSHAGISVTHLITSQIITFTDLPRQASTPQLMINTWNQNRIELGPPIREFFYLESDAANFFNEIASSTDWIKTHYYALWDFNQFNATFVNNTDIATFSLIANGQYRNDTLNTNFKGTYEFTFVYNQTSGIMQGYRIDFDYKGIITGMDVTFIYLQEVEILGYDLPERINTSVLPGFSFDIFIVVFLILSLYSIKSLKKKH
ncbi:MAG: choice-of-anchor S family protein [Candidatus Thorarchaeota archaeon]